MNKWKAQALGPVAKLLIYGLFRKGRVLAQDGISTGHQQQTAAALRSRMLDRDTPFLPSQLFGRFVVADREKILLEGLDFGALYESLLARPGKVSLSLSTSDDGSHAELGASAIKCCYAVFEC